MWNLLQVHEGVVVSSCWVSLAQPLWCLGILIKAPGLNHICVRPCPTPPTPLSVPGRLACTCMGTLPRWEPMWQYLVKISNIQVDITFIIPEFLDEVPSHAKGGHEDWAMKEVWGTFEHKCDLAWGLIKLICMKTSPMYVEGQIIMDTHMDSLTYTHIYGLGSTRIHVVKTNKKISKRKLKRCSICFQVGTLSLFVYHMPTYWNPSYTSPHQPLHPYTPNSKT